MSYRKSQEMDTKMTKVAEDRMKACIDIAAVRFWMLVIAEFPETSTGRNR
jgi:hypothetical protein